MISHILKIRKPRLREKKPHGISKVTLFKSGKIA